MVVCKGGTGGAVSGFRVSFLARSRGADELLHAHYFTHVRRSSIVEHRPALLIQLFARRHLGATAGKKAHPPCS